MIRKVLFGVVVVLTTAIATASPVVAEPSPFSVLNCSCDGSASFQPRGTMNEQIDTGIQNGLANLLGDGG